MHARRCPHSHIHPQTYSHAYTRTRARTHAQTHTRTRRHAPSRFRPCSVRSSRGCRPPPLQRFLSEPAAGLRLPWAARGPACNAPAAAQHGCAVSARRSARKHRANTRAQPDHISTHAHTRRRTALDCKALDPLAQNSVALQSTRCGAMRACVRVCETTRSEAVRRSPGRVTLWVVRDR